MKAAARILFAAMTALLVLAMLASGAVLAQPPGVHTLGAQLVNNDHTPLVAPVTAEVTVTVVAPLSPETAAHPSDTNRGLIGGLIAAAIVVLFGSGIYFFGHGRRGTAM